MGRRSRKGEQRGRGGDLEEARLYIGTGIKDLGQQRRERVVVDQLSGDADSLVEADQMRAGEGMDRVAAGFERGAQEGDGRSLAVGSGDVEHRRQFVLWP